MKKSNNKYFFIAGGLLLTFILFTVALMAMDVRSIGPDQSSVGLGALNGFVLSELGANMVWYRITAVIGVLSIIIALGFAIAGVIQLIKRKSFRYVDKSIIALGVFYVILVDIYIFFELFVVNYRPIIMDGIFEASYPSSHTMIVLFIMGTAMIQFHFKIKKDNLRVAVNTCLAVLIVIMIVGRLLSGVHWFTDIIGGILLGAALIMFYFITAQKVTNEKIYLS